MSRRGHLKMSQSPVPRGAFIIRMYFMARLLRIVAPKGASIEESELPARALHCGPFFSGRARNGRGGVVTVRRIGGFTSRGDPRLVTLVGRRRLILERSHAAALVRGRRAARDPQPRASRRAGQPDVGDAR